MLPQSLFSNLNIAGNNVYHMISKLLCSIEKNTSEGSIILTLKHYKVRIEGDQSLSPQNLQLWRVDYLELMTTGTYQTHKELFTFPSSTLNNLERDLVPGRVIIRNKFLYHRDLSAWHGKDLFIKHQLFSSTCDLSSIWSPRPLLYLPRSGWYMSLSYLTARESHFYGAPVDRKSCLLAYLLLICFMSI